MDSCETRICWTNQSTGGTHVDWDWYVMMAARKVRELATRLPGCVAVTPSPNMVVHPDATATYHLPLTLQRKK